MRDIHVAIIQCIEAVLSDLKRSNGDVRSSSSYATLSLIEAVEPRRSECTRGIFPKFRHDCSAATEPSLASRWPSHETACRRFEYTTSAIAVRFLSLSRGFNQHTSGTSSVMMLLPSKLILSPSSRLIQPMPPGISNTIGVPGCPQIQRTSFSNPHVEDVLFRQMSRSCGQMSKKRLGMYLTRSKRLMGSPFFQSGYLRI